MKIAYYKCLCKSQHKLMAKQLSSQGIEVRVIKNNPEWRELAKQYNVALPFLVDGEQVTQL